MEEVKFVADEYSKLKDEYELDKLTLDDIKKLKEEKVEFSHKSDDGKYESPEQNLSKFDILERSLILPDNKKDLKKSSSDLKMLLNVGPDSEYYEDSYYAYIDVLGESVEKALIKVDRDDDKCYLDLDQLDSVPEIIQVLRMFDSLDKKNVEKHEKILKYISDNVEKFNYKMVLEKFDDIIKEIGEKGYKDRDGLHHEVLKYDELEEDITKYRREREKLEKSDDYKKYCEAKSLYDKLKSQIEDKTKLEKKEGWKKEKDDDKFNVDGATKLDEKEKIKYKGLEKDINDLEIKLQDDYDSYVEKDKDGKLTLKSQDYPNEINLKVKLNIERFDEWKATFKKFKETKENDDNEKKKG